MLCAVPGENSSPFTALPAELVKEILKHSNSDTGNLRLVSHNLRDCWDETLLGRIYANRLFLKLAKEGHKTELATMLERASDSRLLRNKLNYQQALFDASANGRLEVVRLLLEQENVDASANNNFLIRWASANGRLEVVRLLLEQGNVDASANNNFLIRWASANGRLEVVRLLLEQGNVDASADDNYAI